MSCFSLADGGQWGPITLLLILSLVHRGASIGCYSCSSVNGSDPGCEDVFRGSSERYDPDCMASWTLATERTKTRPGKFPAKWCIKLTAYDEEKDVNVVIRTCALENGGINTDTEIGMATHCGWVNQVIYNGKEMQGCLTSCSEDGCNHGHTARSSPVALALLSILAAFILI